MPNDPVLQWVNDAKRAGQRYNIPPAVLLGLVSIESGGREGLTSSANAGGLTQFIPGTARSYGVNVAPGHAASQLMGAAHYLTDLGFHDNPAAALAKYNAGPAAGYAQRAGSYPQKVLAAAKRYAGINGSVPASSSEPSPVDAPVTHTSDDDGQFVDDHKRSGALKALMYVVTVAAGAVLFGLGTSRAFGLRAPTGAPA
ncbi:MAG TPA: lytic transglycosylase domain-containing protein [Solirubrobacteraceae bacterium]|nr:lytic transglycosylase domain-containing protein [Solirubrobacteraceae bacterium]